MRQEHDQLEVARKIRPPASGGNTAHRTFETRIAAVPRGSDAVAAFLRGRKTGSSDRTKVPAAREESADRNGAPIGSSKDAFLMAILKYREPPPTEDTAKDSISNVALGGPAK